MLIIKRGITREVFVGRKFVFKIPSFRSWKLFISGLLANIQEKEWWKTKNQKLCPVKFSLWGGFLNIIIKAEPFSGIPDWKYFEGLPIDPKQDNIGVLDGKIVLIDYGS